MAWLLVLALASTANSHLAGQPARRGTQIPTGTNSRAEGNAAALPGPTSGHWPIDELLEHCHQAEKNEDWVTAETLWRRAILLDGRLAAARTRLAAALQRQGRLVDAEALLQDAPVLQLPPDPDLSLAFADLAQMRGDWIAAQFRWRTTRENFPHIWYSYTGGAAALRELGRLDELAAALRNRRRFDAADSVLRDATTRFPSDHTGRQALPGRRRPSSIGSRQRNTGARL